MARLYRVDGGKLTTRVVFDALVDERAIVASTASRLHGARRVRHPWWIVTMIALVPAIAVAQPAPDTTTATTNASTEGERRDPSELHIKDRYNVTAARVLGPVALVGAAGASSLFLAERGQEKPISTFSIGMAAISLAPSAGHWYVGHGVTRGLVVRTIGGAILTGTLLDYGSSCLHDREELDAPRCSDGWLHGSLLMAGLGAFVFGTVDDFYSAGDEARARNAAHRRSFVLAPTAAPGQVGFALAGTF